MKILFLHSDYIKIFPTEKAVEEAEEIEKKEIYVENCLVSFVAVEKYDNIETVKKAVENIENVLESIKVNKVVIYPYVHLTRFPKDSENSLIILREIANKLKEKGYEVYRAPFGWYKSFEIKVKGHPLAELSRNIYTNIDPIDYLLDTLKVLGVQYEFYKEKEDIVVKIKETKEAEKPKLTKRYIILFPNGKEYLITRDLGDEIEVIDWNEVISKYQPNVISNIDFDIRGNEKINKKSLSENFLTLIEKEALGKEYGEVKENPIRKAMEKFGFEWEEYSDYGHMRYKPYAALIVDLVSDYAIKIAKNLDIPIFIIKGTNMFDLEKGPVAQHAKLFGERMYEVFTDKSRYVLRYAACFQQFSIAKDLVISYKDLPFGMLEIADSYRFEQPGEVLLGFRLRKFTMPDLHIFCKDINEARNLFFYMHKKIMEEIRKIGEDYELLINFGSPEIYEKYKWVIEDILKDVNKPVLICLYPPSDERYWITNIEYNIIDLNKRVREIGTTQIDIGNGKRFEIKYFDENGKENYVIILHNAIIGSVERYIYAVFNSTLKKEKPELPLWLSPVQVRIIPVSDKNLSYAEKVAKTLEEKQIRVEIDDRNLSVGKKIMEAEKLWIPYIIVVGEEEESKNIINVRRRNGGRNSMKVEDLIKEIKEKTNGYPFRPLYSPIYLSKRPSNL